MADEQTDLLMRIRVEREDLVGGSQAIILDTDSLAKDGAGGPFVQGKCFLLDEFDFGLGNRFGDTSSTTEAKDSPNKPRRPSNWISDGREALADLLLEIEPFGFRRLMDSASLALFTACSRSLTLANASVIKRRAIGKLGLNTFLRLDFTDVLITELRWQDGRVVTEECKFICRGIRLRFRPQNADGFLGAAVEGKWPAVPS